MELKVKKTAIKPPKYQKCYKIVIDFMIGDADGDMTETVIVKEDNPDLEAFIKCVEMCTKAFERSGMGGSDTYSDVPGYDRFFSPDYDNEDDEPQISAERPNEPNDYGNETSFESYTVTYFDEQGQEFPVEVKFSASEIATMKKDLKNSGYYV